MHINPVRSRLTSRKPFQTPLCRSRHLLPCQRHSNPQRSPRQLRCPRLVVKECRAAVAFSATRNNHWRSALSCHPNLTSPLADPMAISAIRIRPQSGDQPVESLHARLRQATAESHRMLDKLFGGFDLRQRAGYRRFLEASAAALLPLEAALVEAGVKHLFPDWPLRSRRRAILDDLARIDGTVHLLAPAATEFRSNRRNDLCAGGVEAGRQGLVENCHAIQRSCRSHDDSLFEPWIGPAFVAKLSRHARASCSNTGQNAQQ